MDIVGQLRAESAARHPLSHLAAHEIERLRAALEDMIEALEDENPLAWSSVLNVARAALSGE